MKTWVLIIIVFLSGLIFYFFKENLAIEKKLQEIKIMESAAYQTCMKQAGDEIKQELAYKYKNETVAYEMMIHKLEGVKSEVRKLEEAL